MWKRIEQLAHQIHFADTNTQEFVEVSATYGRIKYEIVGQAWAVLLAGKLGDKSRQYDHNKIQVAIACYDKLWNEWQELAKAHPCCATIYLDVGFDHKPGLGVAINRYR